MRKHFLFAICIILLAFYATSCKEDATTANLRVELRSTSRTISASEGDMEITGYRIIPTGPDGKVGSTRYTYYSYCNIEDLAFGQWKIEAYGFNKDRIDIAYGRAETTIVNGNNTITIPVNTLIGYGSLNITFTWDKDEITTPSLKLYLKAQDSSDDEKELIPSITVSEGHASILEANLPSGSYTLRGELFDEDKKVAGFIEAVRITNEKTTKGEITFESEKISDSSSSSITLSNSTSLPIELRIDGVNKLVSVGGSFQTTLSILSRNVKTNDITASWYLDGERVGEGLNCTIKAKSFGDHRIDVVASTPSPGSTGSAHSMFSAVSTVQPGFPYSLKQVDDTKLSLGRDNVIRFIPNGRMLIASNDKATLEVVSVDSEGAKSLNIYKYSQLGIEGSVSDIASAGIAADKNYTVYVLTNNKPSIVALSYTQNGEALSFKAKQSNLLTSDDAPIVSLGPALGISNGKILDSVIVAAATANSRATGPIFLYPDVSKGDTDFIMANFVNSQKNLFGEGPIYNFDYSEETDSITAVSGSTGIVYLAKMGSSGKPALNPTPITDDPAKVIKENYESFTRGIIGRIFSSKTGYGYVLTHNALYFYEKNNSYPSIPVMQKNKSYSFTAHLDKIPMIKGSYDNLYFYMIDNLCKKLYTMEFSNGEFVCDKEKDYILLPTDEYTNIEISRDGSTIVLYNPACPTGDIAILKVSR